MILIHYIKAINMDNTSYIKCVVWDLDNTIWSGIIAESDQVKLKKDVLSIIIELDKRGILQSVASKNNYEDAFCMLQKFGIEEYFLCPQINWGNKSSSISRIHTRLNISLDSIAFIDDSHFELDEVSSVHHQVKCIQSNNIASLLHDPMFNPRFVTDDSKLRRSLYQKDLIRQADEESFVGPAEDFLASLEMVFTLREAAEEDLQRVVELTERTNQLNANGKIYSYDELKNISSREDHKIIICTLLDKYGSYGRIGLSLIKKEGSSYWIELMLMSCRVMSRGVGTVLLNYIAQKCSDEGAQLLANFRDTGRNRMMLVSYKFSGFEEFSNSSGACAILRHNPKVIKAPPGYINLIAEKSCWFAQN